MTRGTSAILAALSVMGLLFILLLVASTVFRWNIGAVANGCMEPLVAKGDLIVTRPVDPSSIREGDVIAYRPVENPEAIVVRRVKSVVELDTGVSFRTQGDADSEADRVLVPAENVTGKIALQIPDLGHVLNLLVDDPGRLAEDAFPSMNEPVY